LVAVSTLSHVTAWPPPRTVQSGAHARDHGLVIVTKDENFHRLSVLLGPPPKVIWVRLGNCSTDDVIRLLQVRREAIEGFVAHEEAAFLALA